MKRINCSLFKLLRIGLGLAIIAVTPLSASAAQKHALLIGISDYGYFHSQTPEANRLFPNLDCSEDVQKISDALVHTFKFADPKQNPDAGEIVTLTTPEQTTRASIMAALQHLVDVTGTGDIVYIHYSGHGDQVRDDSEPTGLDSAIVPADYKTPVPSNYTEQGTNEISGETIRGFIAKLANKHPAQIALSFDSCHSASDTRGAALAKKRGISYGQYVTWYIQNVDPNYHDTPPAPDAAAKAKVHLGSPPAQSDLNGAGYVVISACRNTDCAYETDSAPIMGRLSDCLAQALTEATPQTTYRQVFDQVYAMFHEDFPGQYPQLDGSDPDAPLFGGNAVVLPDSIEVLGSEGRYILDAGSLQGMTVGSVFAIYGPKETVFKQGTELADATISSISPTTSVLKLIGSNAGSDRDDLNGARARETAHDYDTPPLTLDVASLRQYFPNQAAAIEAKLTNESAGLGMVSTNPLPAGKPYDIEVAQITSRGGPATINLVRVSSGTTIATLDPAQGDLPGQVYAALQKEARYRYACGLGDSQAGLNPYYHLNIRIVPTDSAGNPLPQPKLPPTNRIQTLPLNSYFIIQVQNLSAKWLHVAVLDLESSGDVSQLWPPEHSTAQDNVVLPTSDTQWKTLWVDTGGNTQIPAVIQATSADPDEMYKAIGTLAAAQEGDPDEYVDFTPLTNRGASRGPQSPFSDLFGPAVDSGVRGTSLSTNINAGTWTAATLPFSVK